MTCIWRIHGSKPNIVRWCLVYNTSVFCFSHFHLEGWVGGLSQMKLTSFEKNSHFETIPNINEQQQRMVGSVEIMCLSGTTCCFIELGLYKGL